MALDPKVFKAYDVRGLYPEELDEDGAATHRPRLRRALRAGRRSPSGATHGSPLPPWPRPSIEGVLDAGADVVDIGLVGTEMLYFAVGELELDGGIMVTASHNPKEYTGMKIVRAGRSAGRRRLGPPRRPRPCDVGAAPHRPSRGEAAASEDVYSRLHRAGALVRRARGYPAAPGRFRRCERHGRLDAATDPRPAARRRRPLFLRAGRQLPESRAESAAAGEPRVHRPQGARRRRRPRHRLRRGRRPLLLRRRRGRVRPRRLRHGTPRGSDAREGAWRRRSSTTSVRAGLCPMSSRPPAERRS